MVAKKYLLILAVVSGVLCVLSFGRVELPLPEDEAFLIGRAHPELAGIKGLRLDIVMPEDEAKKHALVWNKLKEKVEKKLKEAGVKVVPQFDRIEIRSAGLRVNIDMLKLSKPQQYIFHIQTSLARMVYLAEKPKLGIQADVWKASAVMQAVSAENMPTSVSNQVLHEIDVFIEAYRAANPPGKQSSDTNDIGTISPIAPKDQTQPAAKLAVAEYKYVASKNSQVFHKPECRWAQRIKPENLVGYNSRQEAIDAGKRPCKQCKP